MSKSRDKKRSKARRTANKVACRATNQVINNHIDGGIANDVMHDYTVKRPIARTLNRIKMRKSSPTFDYRETVGVLLVSGASVPYGYKLKLLRLKFKYDKESNSFEGPLNERTLAICQRYNLDWQLLETRNTNVIKKSREFADDGKSYRIVDEVQDRRVYLPKRGVNLDYANPQGFEAKRIPDNPFAVVGMNGVDYIQCKLSNSMIEFLELNVFFRKVEEGDKFAWVTERNSFDADCFREHLQVIAEFEGEDWFLELADKLPLLG